MREEYIEEKDPFKEEGERTTDESSQTEEDGTKSVDRGETPGDASAPEQTPAGEAAVSAEETPREGVYYSKELGDYYVVKPRGRYAGLVNAALILGIVSLASLFFTGNPFLSLAAGAAAVVLGIVSLAKGGKDIKAVLGLSFGAAGIVLSIVAMVLVVVAAFLVLLFNVEPIEFNYDSDGARQAQIILKTLFSSVAAAGPYGGV